MSQRTIGVYPVYVGVVAGRAPGDACVLWSIPIVPWMSDGSMVIWDGR